MNNEASTPNKQPFNIHAARRLETLKMSELHEASAVQRETDLNALIRAEAAQGGAISGSLLKQEVEIIFRAVEGILDTVIAYRQELASKAPELLLPYPYLKEFQTQLDELVDGAVISVQQRHAQAHAGHFHAEALKAILGIAVQRANVLKNRINNKIQAMALEGNLASFLDPSAAIACLSAAFHWKYENDVAAMAAITAAEEM